MTHLKDYNYYEDRYDRMTVKDALWYEGALLGDPPKSEHSKKFTSQ